jgi:hypothetical protein
MTIFRNERYAGCVFNLLQKRRVAMISSASLFSYGLLAEASYAFLRNVDRVLEGCIVFRFKNGR